MNGYKEQGHANGLMFHGSSGSIGYKDDILQKGKIQNSNPSLSQSEDSMYRRGDETNYTSYSDSDLADNGPHREMAIDCPSSFVGARKERPSFPSSLSRGSPKGTPRKKREVLSERRPYEQAQSNTPSKTYQPPKMTPEEEMEQQERIKRYQADLKKRREEEERIAKEEEFLRTSLRGSKKLQELEERRIENRENRPPPHPGIDNPMYTVYPEEEQNTSISKASTLKLRDDQGKTADGTEKKLLGKEDIAASLQKIQSKLKSVDDQKDIAFLARFFYNDQFQKSLSIHNKIIDITLQNPQPIPESSNAHDTRTQALNSLPTQTRNPYVEELRRLLQNHNLKNLLITHDGVAKQRTIAPQAATGGPSEDDKEYLYERASQYNEDSIKIVRLQKTADPLGATVRNDGDSVIIGRIVKGGAAEKSGLLHEGDEILEINGIDMRSKDVNEVCELMASMTGTLTFLVIPNQDDMNSSLPPERTPVEEIHVQAHFNYDPEEDMYIPCRELGISFQKGDILHVISQEDANWWQAYREGEDDQALAGLIPSKSFQEQREAIKQTVVEEKSNGKKKQKCRCVKKKNKKKKQMYNANGEDIDAEEILTYEEVALYNPQPNRKRPIVLIGPPNVGRQELRKRLMESDVERFAAAIPHTSRPRLENETDGKDYHFVPRHVFEADIDAHKFVEYGEYEKNLYGTSLEAIREKVNSGKICILNLYPQSLRILKASDLKPYVVFVAPPNLEKLKQIRQKQKIKATDEELKEIIEKAREMEDNYEQYFHCIIVNVDIDKSYEELLAEINRLEVEPQWVPAQWVR